MKVFGFETALRPFEVPMRVAVECYWPGSIVWFIRLWLLVTPTVVNSLCTYAFAAAATEALSRPTDLSDIPPVVIV